MQRKVDKTGFSLGAGCENPSANEKGTAVQRVDSDATQVAVPWAIGHRGAAGHAPENTLASIRKAAVLGVRWVEVDARLSRDGRVILFHDDALERTTNGRGRVAETDLKALEALDAGGWFGQAFRGERIPTLDAAVAELQRLGLGANIEVKPDPGREREAGEAAGPRAGRRPFFPALTRPRWPPRARLRRSANTLCWWSTFRTIGVSTCGLWDATPCTARRDD